MKRLFILLLALSPILVIAQERHMPIVKNFGGVYDVPYATVKPDPSKDYKVVVEIATASDQPGDLNPSLLSAARLMNLHGVGGVPKEKLHIVLVVHAASTYALMNDDAYKTKYKIENPNLKLLEQLKEAGARIVVCGQSLTARNVDPNKLAPGIETGISMLTTVTTFQLDGYTFLKF